MILTWRRIISLALPAAAERSGLCLNLHPLFRSGAHCFHRLCRMLILTTVFTSALLLSACKPAEGIHEIRQATLILDNSAGAASSLAVSLPHSPELTLQTNSREWVYQVLLPPELASSPERAIWLPGQLAGLRLLVDGQEITSQAVAEHWSAGVLAVIPKIGKGQPGLLELRMPTRDGILSSLKRIQVGDAVALTSTASAQMVLASAADAITFGIAAGASAILLGMAVIRPQALYFVLALALAGVAARQGQFLIFGLWTLDGPGLALYSGSRFVSAIFILLALPIAAGQRYRDLLVLTLISMTAAVILSVGGWGTVGQRRTILFVMALAIAVPALARSVGPLIRQRSYWLFAAVVISVVQLLAFVRNLMIMPDRITPGTFVIASIGAGIGVVIMVFFMAAEFRRAFAQSEALNLSLREEAEQYKAAFKASMEREQAAVIRNATDRERARWMREIHDGLGSQLLAARILSGKQPKGGNTRVLIDVLDEALDQLRMLVEALAPDRSTVPTLLGAMRYRLAPRLEATGLALTWVVEEFPDAGVLEPEVALNVQRIVQEALSNVLKHSQARSLEISIQREQDRIIVRIDDDGIGFDPQHVVPGRGLISMRVRAAESGATLRVSPLVKGTRVELSLPLQTPSQLLSLPQQSVV